MKNIEDIIKKYPKIFEDYKGNPGRVNWSCPTGWLKVLDWLCGSIQGYTDNINENNKHLDPVAQVTCQQVKEKFAGLRFYYSGGHRIHTYKWYQKPVVWLYRKVIKRIFVHDAISGMVEMAEHICWETCQNCGTNEKVNLTGTHWLNTLCDDCANKSYTGV